MNILVTGCAGFIGAALTQSLLDQRYSVTGIDNFSDYYDPELKRARLRRFEGHPNFRFLKQDITHLDTLLEIFSSTTFDRVVHLAAQVGVRYSLQNPHAFVNTNVAGFLNILEGCRHHGVKHLVYASTSSVYGLNSELPLSIHQNTDHPISLYSATKKSNELMAHSYSHMFGLPTTGVRFFTVYGPWGRPDMALFLFTKSILRGVPIRVFNHGRHRRDFTYIDDLVIGLGKIIASAPPGADPSWDSKYPDPAASSAPYRVFNIGANTSIELIRFIEIIEECTGRMANKILEESQMGDVDSTWADVSDLVREFDYRPSTPIEVGVKNFVDWYRDYFKV